MSYFEVKQEPVDTYECQDPLQIDLADLIKVEITDNPVCSPEEEALFAQPTSPPPLITTPIPPLLPFSIELPTPSKLDIEKQMNLFDKNETERPKSVFPIRKVNSLFKVALRTSTSNVESSSLVNKKRKVRNLTVDETVYDQMRKLKKVKLERERRVVMRELFDDLDYWVQLGMDEITRR